MRSAVIAAASLGLMSCASSAPSTDDACALTQSESAWIDRSLEAWRRVRTDRLRVPDNATPPTLVFFNETCTFQGEGGPPWRGVPHNGAVTLPNDKKIPAQVASFASPYAENTRAFFTMALPSIWRAGGVQSDLGLETLTTAVLIHEMTHTRQFDAFNPRLDALDRHYGLGDDLTDDIVQNTFRENADFVAAYEAERDLLFRAAAAPTDAEARALAAEALRRMRARAARFFVGEHEKLVELENIFLTLEGAAQWAAYAWVMHPQGAAVAAEIALPQIRRGGRQWSQDEGLALYLVVDRLTPDWQARAFAAEPATAMELLALAAAPPAH